MTVQTTFADKQRVALAGGLHGFGPRRVQPAINEEAAEVPWGLVMVRGSAPENEFEPLALLPSAAGQDVLGIVVRTFHTDDESTGVATLGVLDLLQEGQIWVDPEVDVSPGDDVFFVHTGGDEGSLRNDADVGNADQLLGARFETSGGPTSGAPALVTITKVEDNS